MRNSIFKNEIALQQNRGASRLYKILGSITIGDCFWLLLFNILAFQIYFQELYGGVFNYLDEVTSLLILATTLVTLFSRARNGEFGSRGIIVALMFFFSALIIGVASNITSGVDVRGSAILIDIFTFCKLPLAVMCCAIMPNAKGRHSALWKLLVLEAQVLIAVMAMCAVINILSYGHMLDMGAGFRYGISSFRFIFYHPEVVNIFVVGLVAILLIDKPNGHRFFIILALLIMYATLRTKAMGFALAAGIILLTARKGKITVWHVLFALIAAIFIASDQLSNYYENGDSARSMLTSAGTWVANNFAPFGSGFATFGSAVTASVENYSPLYYLFGFDSYFGLSPLNPHFVSDTFWPTVAAQLGYIGAVCYALAIIMIFKLAYDRFEEKKRGIVVVVVVIYLAISTTASSALFAPQWVYVMFVLYLGMRHLSVETPSMGSLGKHQKGLSTVRRQRYLIKKRELF